MHPEDNLMYDKAIAILKNGRDFQGPSGKYHVRSNFIFMGNQFIQLLGFSRSIHMWNIVNVNTNYSERLSYTSEPRRKEST